MPHRVEFRRSRPYPKLEILCRGCDNGPSDTRWKTGEVPEVIRLFLCAGLFILGYYVGRTSNRQDSIPEETGRELQDQEEV